MTRCPLRDGGTLAFEDRGDGHALLLIHGFTGSSRAWPPEVVDALARRFRVLVPDLIGHGESDRHADPGRYALGRVVSDLCELQDACEIERAAWVGYSMGGRVALGGAVLRPERIRALVLEGSSPGLADPDERTRRAHADDALAGSIEKDGVDRFVESWTQQPLFATQRRLDEGVRDRQRALRLRNDPASLAACLRGLGTGVQPCLWGALGALSMPVLLIAGQHDAKFLDIARSMQREIPHAHLTPIEDAGHTTHLEQPGRYVASVLSFLDAAQEEDTT